MKRYGKRFWKVDDFLTVLMLIVGMFVIDVHVLFSGKHFEISLLLITLEFNVLPFGFCRYTHRCSRLVHYSSLYLYSC